MTHEDYLIFLHDLIAQGREEEALKHAPRERSHTSSKAGELLYKFEDNQLFYFKDKKLISYDLNRFSETEMMLPKLSLDAKNIRIERAEKLLAVLKENKLELFLIED